MVQLISHYNCRPGRDTSLTVRSKANHTDRLKALVNWKLRTRITNIKGC